MEAKDLRIGNFVNYIARPKICKVIETAGSGVLCEFIDDKLTMGGFAGTTFDAIPLTEKWLEKLGFELCNNYYHKYYKSYSAEMRIKRRDNECFSVRLKRNNKIMLIEEISFVHQLQNLYYALTRDELVLAVAPLNNCS